MRKKKGGVLSLPFTFYFITAVWLIGKLAFQ